MHILCLQHSLAKFLSNKVTINVNMFVISWKMGLATICITTLLSQIKLIGRCILTPSSLNNLTSQVTSFFFGWKYKNYYSILQNQNTYNSSYHPILPYPIYIPIFLLLLTFYTFWDYTFQPTTCIDSLSSSSPSVTSFSV